MMAPHYERARMLCAAIHAATDELNEPIDRVEVRSRCVLLWAGNKRIALKYYYANSYDPTGGPMPGGGHWVVEKVGLADMSLGLHAGLLSRLQRAFARARGKDGH